MKHSLFISLFFFLALYALSPSIATNCGLGFTDFNPFNPGLSVDSGATPARKFVLDGTTQVEILRLPLERHSDSGTLRIEFRNDEDGLPGSTVLKSYQFSIAGLNTLAEWREFPEMACTLNGGTYWIVLSAVSPGDAKVLWSGKSGNLCGDSADNLSYTIVLEPKTHGEWRKQTIETNYEIVCHECPCLRNPKVTPAQTSDNGERPYTYEVTYKNLANILPSSAQICIGGNWYGMTRMDSNMPDYGTRYAYTHKAPYRDGIRLGVGTHSYTLRFSCSTSQGTLTSEITCSGPTVGPGHPKISTASFNPNPARTNQTVNFTATASDSDGGTIATYQWRLVERTTNAEQEFPVPPGTSSSISKSASDIGIGLWDVYVIVTDDEGLTSSEFKCPNALEIADAIAPEITACSATLDGRPSADEVGVFIPGLPTVVTNIFTATVVDKGGGISKVEFKMPSRSTGTVTVTATSAPYKAWLNMSDLPDSGELYLEVTAYSSGSPERASPVKRIKLITTPCPGWWGKEYVADQYADWDESKGLYTFTCEIPKPKLDYVYDIPTDSLFGTLHNHFDSGINITEHFHFNGSPWWWNFRADGALILEVLSRSVLNEPYSCKVLPPEFTAGLPEYDRLRSLGRYSVLSPEIRLLEFSIDGPSYDQRGLIDYVEYHVGVSTEIGFELALAMGAEFKPDLSIASFLIEPIPTFSVTFDMFVEIYEGVARLGVKATPAMSMKLPVAYVLDLKRFEARQPCFEFWLDCVLYGSLAFGLLEKDLYTFTYPEPPYDYPAGCADKAPLPAANSPAVRPIFAAPTIVSDRQGISSLCVWVKDTNPSEDVNNPELYYSYSPGPGGGWTTPAPVFPTDNGLFESDPKLVFTAPNQALLVWTQNELSRAESEATEHIMDIIQEQELYYCTWTYNPLTNTGTWASSPSKLTNDDDPLRNPEYPAHHGDGLAALGSDGRSGQALVVWVRETYTPPSPPVTRNPATYASTWEVCCSRWNGTNWSLEWRTQDSTADAQPDVAVGSDLDAVVVWARDGDNNFATNADRKINYRFYTASSTTWGPITQLAGCPVGALSPSAAYDTGGSPIFVFTARDTNSNGQPLHEGPCDRIYAACFTSGIPAVRPIGGDTTGLEPKVKCDSQNNTIAIWRGFERVGRKGFDGDIVRNMREGAAGNCDDWGGPLFLTNDDFTDWQIDFDIDGSDIIRVVDVNDDPSISGGFGGGEDGIRVHEIPRGPDICITDADISFSNDYPSQGEQVIISAKVHSIGTKRPGAVTIEFRTEAGVIGTQSSGFLPYQGFVIINQPWISDGQIHTITVEADSSHILVETNETNNVGEREIGRVSKPTSLIAAADCANSGIALSWQHPGANRYNIYRSLSSGSGYSAVGQSETTGYVDTTAQPDTQYFYVVTAQDALAESAYSNEATTILGPDSDTDAIPNICDADDDNDGMSDECETTYFFNPLDPSDGDDDTDEDGYPNNIECQAGTNPRDSESHPDDQPPTTPIVTTAAYTSDTTKLSASWTSTDDNGIAEYLYAIGASSGTADIRPWTSNGESNTLTVSNLSLTPGHTYYISVKAIDYAGNESTAGVSNGTTVDTSPPSITSGPTVTSWTPESAIFANWSAEDAESGIAKCEYSIGTSPGGTDVVTWTDVGRAFSVNRTGLSLTNGNIYFVNLRVTNGAGLQTTNSSSSSRAVKTPSTIGDALGFADGIWIALRNKTVTAVLGNYLWIQELDSSAAFRVTGTHSCTEGNLVTVVGRIQTPVYTREISSESIAIESTGGPAIPLGMKNLSIGGSARNAYTRGVDGGSGTNNASMLVTTWGEATAIGTDFFYIDDGSGLLDGTGYRGVRVHSAGLANPSPGQFLFVTGLVNASRLEPSGASIRLLIPRRQSDIRTVPVNLFGSQLITSFTPPDRIYK